MTDPPPVLSTRELRGLERGERWLAAGLLQARVEPLLATDVDDLFAVIGALAIERPELPPAGVIADLRALARGASLRPGSAEAPGDLALAEALRRYEDQLLGRLASDPRLEEACAAIARLQPALQPAAIGWFCDRVLALAGYRQGVAVSLGAMRALARRDLDETLAVGVEALRDREPAPEALAEAYGELIEAGRHASGLIDPALVFGLAHFEQLGSAGKRMAIEQLATAAADMLRALPRRAQRRSDRAASVPTLVQDDSTYPAGGFSEISNLGSLENLVASELIYIEPGSPGREKGFDLFDVRYVEGELLYYTRDESVYVRPRRALLIALPAELVRARFMDPGAPRQRLVETIGVLRGVVGRLIEWLRAEAFSVELVFLDDGKEGALDEERDLCEVLFAEAISKGVCALRSAPGAEALAAELDEQARTSVCDLIWVCCQPRRETPELPELLAPRPDSPDYGRFVLDVSRPAPRLLRPGREVLESVALEDDWVSVGRALADALL